MSDYWKNRDVHLKAQKKYDDKNREKKHQYDKLRWQKRKLEHQALLDIKEYIERNKGSWEVSTFSQREDVRKIVWTNEELDILDIVNKALGDKGNE